MSAVFEFVDRYGFGGPDSSCTIADKFLSEGITQLIEQLIGSKLVKPSLNVRGILLTMYDKRNKLSSQVEKMRDYFKDKVYQTVVLETYVYQGSLFGVPVLIMINNVPAIYI